MKVFTFAIDAHPRHYELKAGAATQKEAHALVWASMTEPQKNAAASLECVDESEDYDYFTLRMCRPEEGGVDVLGWSTYPESSVLAGQTMKVWLGSFDTAEQARAVFPSADNFSSRFTEPQVSVSHLPGEDDPVPGGMYPDDYN